MLGYGPTRRTEKAWPPVPVLPVFRGLSGRDEPIGAWLGMRSTVLHRETEDFSSYRSYLDNGNGQFPKYYRRSNSCPHGNRTARARNRLPDTLDPLRRLRPCTSE
jgi:hypothetical protein